ncbi:uncharacterized protein LOC144477662 [Augochlora pura]
MSVLDISKICLYDFHYGYMLPNFLERCKILYTDTDSLIYRITCDDVYETIKRDIDRYDTSIYDRDNAYGVPIANNKVIGLMKDENGGKITMEFVGLRSKMYATRVENKNDVKKIKEISTNATIKSITFDDFLACLYNHLEKSVCIKLIKSLKHCVYSISQMKLALSPHDDKRYITDNSIDTLPWGHYDITRRERGRESVVTP